LSVKSFYFLTRGPEGLNGIELPLLHLGLLAPFTMGTLFPPWIWYGPMLCPFRLRMLFTAPHGTGARHLAPGTWYLVPGTWHLWPATWSHLRATAPRVFLSC